MNLSHSNPTRSRPRWSPNAQPSYITKGTIVYSTHPQWPREGKPLTRGQAVMAVKDASGRLTWPGSGGYWKWVQGANPS